MATKICAMPGCDKPVAVRLSMRSRRRDTSAQWAPNLDVGLCGDCAKTGADIEIRLTPRRDKQLRTVVLVGSEEPRVRMTPIRHAP